MEEDIHPIKKARNAKGLSLRDVAWAIGINLCSFARIHHYEIGLYAPRLARANRLAELLGFESGKELRRLCHEWRKRNVVEKEVAEWEPFVCRKCKRKETEDDLFESESDICNKCRVGSASLR
jgi:transcriptional regulator with XRE-family HTH domain